MNADDARWIVYALLGALFAAITSVLSKPALDSLDVAVANSIRALIMLVVMVIAATIQGRWWTLGLAAEKSQRAILLITLAGVAAAMSWLFGYRALQLANVSKTYPLDKLSVVFGVVLAAIFLGERPNLTNWIGIAVMIGGGYLVTRK